MNLSPYDEEKLNLLIETSLPDHHSLFTFERSRPKNNLNLQSTLKDVADFFDVFNEFDAEYKFKKENAQDFKIVLQMWITEIEVIINLVKASAGGPHKLLSNAYLQIAKGNNPILRNYEDDLLTKIDIGIIECEYNLVPYGLYNIAKGVVFAYKLPELKNELNELSNEIIKRQLDSISQIELANIKSTILVLRELGIIQLLNEKFNSNNTKVAECLGMIIKEKPASIRGILSNIHSTANNSTNPENIPALENAITVLNNLGCTNEVLNLQSKLAKLI